MNLQICIPYQVCPFKCPMCIASGRPIFENLYKSEYDFYIHQLEEALKNNDIEDIILTGNTDPTLDRNWLTKISEEVKKYYPSPKVELQTKNYNLKNYNLSNIDVLAYSITSVKDYLKAWSFRKIQRTNRLSILLTKEFDFLTAENFNTFGFDQITFKVLHEGVDIEKNKWVQDNKMTDLSNIYDIINRFNGTETSVRIDTECENSIDRYLIFREDGELYKEW